MMINIQTHLKDIEDFEKLCKKFEEFEFHISKILLGTQAYNRS